ncbi:BatD family protein [Candidatus Venteria ishoeyi]|uniref:DUF7939 domain-containing protein n=1 Tax=Candidatus Venteria ishoeyi TaxID=1899563 RepID=A0A1H6FCJ1_9GAMM|nr:BatD family protein [Candidatus Venteria ishoeyi]SEH07039.1 Uncharacterised protein [Candidatus Venteria ishoeyi]
MKNYQLFATPFVIILWLYSTSTLAAFTAKLDRQTISEQDSFLLTLQVDKQSQESPDLSILEQDFDLISSSQSTEMQTINGRSKSLTRWQISLLPKSSGELVIPAIRLGQEQTQPLTLKVTPEKTKEQSGAYPEIFLEVEVKPETAYLQSQITYILRLYHSLPLNSGQITPPQPNHARVEKLGENKRYQTRLEGKNYGVVEQYYAIFPEQSGNLQIPPVQFQGLVMGSRTQKRPFMGFYSDSGRTVRKKSKALSIKILPRPSVFPQQAVWLPARAVSLGEQWSVNPLEFQVGEPVTRTITLSALGLYAEHLPTLSPANPETFKQYPDQAQTETRLTDSEHLLMAQQQQPIALVPTQAGQFTLPEISLPWWDTQQGELRYARLPARTVTVLPAAVSDKPTPVTTAPITSTQTNQANNQVVPVKAESIWGLSIIYWFWLALLLTGAWILGLLFYWLSRHHQQNPDKKINPRLGNLKAARKNIERACVATDAKVAREALLAWAKLQWPTQQPRGLAQLANLLSVTASQQAILELERYLYGGSSTAPDWDGAEAWQRIRMGLHEDIQDNDKSNPLPELYPAA